MLLHAASPLLRSLVTAPLWAAMAVGGVQAVAVFAGLALWPSWWSAVLALAWAPAFWRPAGHPTSAVRLVAAMGGTAALALAAVAGHALPLGVKDTVAIHGALRLVQAQGDSWRAQLESVLSTAADLAQRLQQQSARASR